jgi:hypothetical protein
VFTVVIKNNNLYIMGRMTGGSDIVERSLNIGCEGVARHCPVPLSCEHCHGPTGGVKDQEFFLHLSDW